MLPPSNDLGVPVTDVPSTPEGDPNAGPPPAYQPPPPPAPGEYGAPPPPGYPAPGTYQPPPAGYGQGYAPATTGGRIGQIRGTGMSIFLFIITFSIYGWFWYYGVHKEMQEHRNGQGLGGAIALILAIFVSVVMPFLTADEVGKLYEARGQQKPVSAITGLWILLPLVGGIVWFVKTNGALNDYWRSLGATS